MTICEKYLFKKQRQPITPQGRESIVSKCETTIFHLSGVVLEMGQALYIVKYTR